MKATQQLHDTGQSLWPDNITRALLTSGGLEQYMRNCRSMTEFVNQVRSGAWRGHIGTRIRNVVKHRHWRLGPWPGHSLCRRSATTAIATEPRIGRVEDGREY